MEIMMGNEAFEFYNWCGEALQRLTAFRFAGVDVLTTKHFEVDVQVRFAELIKAFGKFYSNLGSTLYHVIKVADAGDQGWTKDLKCNPQGPF